MSEEYRAKVFKSGNSVALRLPKALGLVEGDEMRIVREDRAGFTVEPVEAPKRLKPLTREEREFEDSPRVWDDPDWPGWKNA